MRKLNWAIWVGFLISIAAFLSYPTIFVNWETTRDFPWANFVLFAIGDLFIVIGLRRAFAPGRRLPGKIISAAVAMLGALVLAMFIFVAFIAARWLPASANAPQVGQKAPDFTLVDTNNRPVSLAELLTQPIQPESTATSAGPARPPKGVLLIFYRGYW